MFKRKFIPTSNSALEDAILKEQAPKEEVFNTLLAEVEYMVNNRSLTHISVDLNDPEPTTPPNHFWFGKTRKSFKKTMENKSKNFW